MTRRIRALLLNCALNGLALIVSAAIGPAHAADKICIGVVLPKAQLGQGSGGADVSEPVRQSLMGYLGGPATQILPLQARIPVQAEAEAREAGCPYVLYTSIVHRKARSGGGFGALLGAVAPVAGMVPGLGGLGGGAGAMVASQAAAVAATAAAQAQAQAMQEQASAALGNASQGQIRKGDQITLEYQLKRTGQARPLAAKSLQVKAGEDGEDLLSPLLEQEATGVLTAAS